MTKIETADVQPHESRRRGRRLSGDMPGRKALLVAAMSWFSRCGFDGTGLRAIAADAGVDMALVARLFGSKAELWSAVVDFLVEKQIDHRTRLQEIIDNDSVTSADKMRDFIVLFAEISWEIPELPAFLMQEVTNPGERLDIINNKLIKPFMACCMPIVETAIADGVVKAHDPALFLKMLFAAVSQPMVSLALLGNEPEIGSRIRDDIAKEAISMFIS